MAKAAAAPHKAIALEYNSIDELPRITARGNGELANDIIRLAEENNIPVCEHAELVQLLDHASPGNFIDPDSFKLVAEVIAFLYHVETSWQTQHSFLDPILGVTTADAK